MNKFIIIILYFFITNCTLNKVVKHHGVHFLEVKYRQLTINQSNINDITDLLGPPLTKSAFDNNVLIYIEKKTSSTKLRKLGKQILLTNNVLVLELDGTGILLDKKFYTKEDMSKIDFDKAITVTSYNRKEDFVYSFLSSVRQKVNDPLGKKRIKNK
jgi:outer membrane protein assembly factor BamE (lipoprotein component of BamABCDE complex)